MKSVIRKIDRALKRLYPLEPSYRAEDFLIKEPFHQARAAVGSGRSNPAASDFDGALFIKAERSQEELALGIYLNASVWKELMSFRKWPEEKWSFRQIAAFVVAAEEVSHFHYLLFHSSRGRAVSQLELELQGEIDKFVITFFATLRPADDPKAHFHRLFDQLFEYFRLASHLTPEQRSRYADASNFAKVLVRKCERYLVTAKPHPQAFEFLRRVYRMPSAEKISFILS